MVDILIITVLAIVAFFILRSQLHKLRSGQCSGGCPGCSGTCGGCSRCAEDAAEAARD